MSLQQIMRNHGGWERIQEGQIWANECIGWKEIAFHNAGQEARIWTAGKILQMIWRNNSGSFGKGYAIDIVTLIYANHSTKSFIISLCREHTEASYSQWIYCLRTAIGPSARWWNECQPRGRSPPWPSPKRCPLNTNSASSLPSAPGDCLSTFYLSEFGYASDLIQVESDNICPFAFGLFQLA